MITPAMKVQQATAESIISNFGKQSDFTWLKTIQDAGLLYLGTILMVLLLNSCEKSNENKIGYRVYVEDNNLIYFDDVTGKEIYRETFNWENPSGVQKAIINDNK